MYFIILCQIIFQATVINSNEFLLTEQKPELLLHHQDTFYLYGDYREHFPLEATLLFLHKSRVDKLFPPLALFLLCRGNDKQ